MREGSDEIVKLTGKIVLRTEKAIKFSWMEPSRNEQVNHWLPLSQIPEMHSACDPDKESVIHVKAWILRKIGLDY